jgi:hypothetical protein
LGELDVDDSKWGKELLDGVGVDEALPLAHGRKADPVAALRGVRGERSSRYVLFSHFGFDSY